ncbi:type II toxin-antitoxin system HicB family antitoxin [Moorena producens]|uniref:type II toxin-antitoxin system HicB family antitoxin n=1 Tax=Moorena producens TaxID=1155739 RepID=UPI003C7425C2
MKVNHQHYTYSITWSKEDGEFVGLCAEFPSLSHLDTSLVAALEGISNLVAEVLEDMEASGEPIPQPLAEKKYSGKFQIRIPPEQHRSLAIKAAESGVSLNRYISLKLCS